MIGRTTHYPICLAALLPLLMFSKGLAQTGWTREPEAAKKYLDKPFPPFTATDILTGVPLSPRDLEGQIVLIQLLDEDSFKSHLGSSHLASIYKKYRPSGVSILTILTDTVELDDCCRRLIQKDRCWYHVAMDSQDDSAVFKDILNMTTLMPLSVDFVSHMPVVFVLDRNGTCFAISTKTTCQFSPKIDISDSDVDKKAEKYFGRASGAFSFLPGTVRLLVDRKSASSKSRQAQSLLENELKSARKIEAAGNKARAALSYEFIARRYGGSKGAKAAHERSRRLMSDESVAQTVRKRWGGFERPSDPFAATLLSAAQAARDRGDFTEARRVYETVIAKYPNSTEAEWAKKELNEMRGPRV